MSWKRDIAIDVKIKFALFLISPFMSLLYSLRRINTKTSFIVFFLFSLLFGLSFTVSDVRFDGTIDGISYRLRFEEFRYVSFNEYINAFNDYLQFDGIKNDFYFETISFWISRLTDNYHILFMFAALVFSFFSLKSFRFLVKHKNFDNSSVVSLLLACFFMTNSIVNINGVRFWTAAWIMTYAVFKIIHDNKKEFIILALLVPFVHGTYWIYVGLIVLYFITKRYERFWIIVFLFSFVFSNISFILIQEISQYLPASLSFIVNNYTNEEYIELRNETLRESNVRYFFFLAMNVYRFIFVYILIKNRESVCNQLGCSNMFMFMLVLVSFAQFTMGIPSLGARYITLSYPIVAYLWLAGIGIRRYRYIIYLYPLFFAIPLYDSINLLNTVIDPIFYFSSPIYLILKYMFLI